MTIYYGDAWIHEMKGLEKEFLNQFFLFLKQRNEAPTLREIKEQFPEKKIEKTLDKLISLKIILRENRRYYSVLTTYPGELTPVGMNWVAEIEVFLSQLAKNEVIDAFLQLAELFSDPQVLFEYEEEKDIAIFRSKKTETLLVTDCCLGESQASILAFFEGNRKKSLLFQKRFAYIGDVEENYYFDQVEVILEKIIGNRKRIRPTIFTRSLVDFQLIQEEGLSFSPVWLDDSLESSINLENFKKTFNSFSDLEKRKIISLLMSSHGLTSIQRVEVRASKTTFFAVC